MPQWLIDLGNTALHRFLPFVLILTAGLLVIKIIMTIIRGAMKKTKIEKSAYNLLTSVIRIVLLLLLGLIAASSLGIDVTGVIALTSVFSLALSLSVQNALTNLIGGFTLLHTKPFRSGDYVEIASQSGTVDTIGMAYTKLITPDNKLVYIPNSNVVSAEITNFTVTGTRRLDISVTASYDAPTEKVLTALQAAADVSGILETPAPFIGLTGYGDSGINYVIRVWTKTEDFWTVNNAIVPAIREQFAAHGVSMTYPHLNVHLDK